MSRHLRGLLLIPSVVLALAIVGCGGDDDGDSGGADSGGWPASATSPLDHPPEEAEASDELDREGYADAIRTIFVPYLDEYEQLDREIRRSTQTLSVNDASEYVDAVREIQGLHRRTISELRPLDPPGATTAGHKALIRALRDISDAYEGLVAAGKAYDPFDMERALKMQRRAVKQIERGQARLTEALGELEAAGVPLEQSGPPGADQ